MQECFLKSTIGPGWQKALARFFSHDFLARFFLVSFFVQEYFWKLPHPSSKRIMVFPWKGVRFRSLTSNVYKIYTLQ